MKLTDNQRKAMFAKRAEEDRIREETLKYTSSLEEWI